MSEKVYMSVTAAPRLVLRCLEFGGTENAIAMLRDLIKQLEEGEEE